MGRPERPLDASGGPVPAFAHDLRALRHRAGNPSYRRLAGDALFSPSVLSSAAGGWRLPTLAVTMAFVSACGGDRVQWERRWREIAERSAVVRDDRPYAPDAGTFVRPAQLPMAAGSFVGRADVIADAGRLIGSSADARTPILISGLAGVGKSALALRLAEQPASRFPDGQLYVDLATDRSDGAAVPAIVRDFLLALGVPAEHVSDNPMQRIGLYRSLLAQRKVFVLLANVRREAQVRPLLAQSAHSQVVLTSRARLLGLCGTYRVHLDVFSRAESLALLRRLAGSARVRAEYEAADAIAELCGDLPLAVSIVGRRIAARPQRTIADTAGQLTDRRRLLDILAVGDMTVRERFASAYQRLSAPARAVVRRLGSNGARSTTAIGVATAMNVPVDTTDELLESLVDAGLVRHSAVAGRYDIPALVSVFAGEMRQI
ncbi:MAG TPA: NB-ARC domain-containing protein [Actinophytocola sp.]|uniref:NB-ARC domain-containing protein n=1 Tax=Actinophytocola sp. TaxID=1872138 RepID=UPI002DDD3FC7|nr:NB-ARC domain-containing protein [Actinophytocola sp.]HEV2780956.1 NB-ARC domain-containing protein [Actinophytocola sp.]